ncbi:MAG: folylpolyglutamate synthase/dihydrofolate synthase family protein [Ferruginibacter sp.]
MNYQQTIDYLFAQLPMYSRIGAAAYKADLDNTIALCDFLDNPQHQFRSVHIAGTNGKGSTSHMLAAMLQQAGYKTGLYTSPHLKDFRERIRINGEMIGEQTVIDFTEKIKTISEKIQPSFFELTVAMAFDYFAEQKVDIAIIETGLGGRLDSTNIITPIVSIITNIGYDHMNLLGDTLQKIATEKAGIIKKNIPVIIGEALAETKDIFIHKAKEENAAIHFVQDQYKVSNIETHAQSLSCDVTDIIHGVTENFTLDLNSIYQTKNLCTVLCTEGILMEAGFKFPNDAEKTALASVKKLTGLHGRWEVVQENPMLVLDVGHNEDGIKAILQQLSVTNYDRLHIVTGFVKDKEVEKVLALLPADALYYFTQAQIPRALDAELLKEKAAINNLYGESYPEVNIALKAAMSNAGKQDLVLVCGSVFLVGEVELGE